MDAKSEYKAPGGLIKVSLSIKDDIINKILITGDFFMFPEESLEELVEKFLIGVKVDANALQHIVNEFLSRKNVQTSLTANDLTTAIMQCANKTQS